MSGAAAERNAAGAGAGELARRTALLAAALLLIGLTVSRVSLVVHELLGHGAVAELVGADVRAWRLFWFGGGWVSYRWTAPPGTGAALAVTLGGVALEVALGAAALWLARRRPAGSRSRLALLSAGALDLLHAGFYLATGTHHGFGDGRFLHHLLGDARVLLVAPAAAAVVAGGVFIAARLARELGGWIGAGGAAARAGAILVAAGLAAAGHGALTAGERALARDETYAGVMRHQSARDVDRDLRRFAREARSARGRPPTPAEIAAARAALEERHRRFPLRPALAGALALACLVGLARGVRAAPGCAAEPQRAHRLRDLAPLALACAAAVALVALL
ncbi:MAG TPA: hypothetical protein VKZ63_14345 [Kofleriaceae bacterium]|nr:hypothetical protein [Kofleriaceae bacterium]